MDKAYYHKEWYAWRDQVLSCVRFRPDHEAIAKELYHHYEDSVLDFERVGYEEKLARERALQAMGDAAEVGRGLDRAHKPWLGWLQKLTEWTAFALVLMLLWTLVFQQGFEDLYYRVRGQLRWQEPPAWADTLETEFGTIYMTLEEPFTQEGQEYQYLNFWMKSSGPLGEFPWAAQWYGQVTTDKGPVGRREQDENGNWQERGFFDSAAAEDFPISESFGRYRWSYRFVLDGEAVEWAEIRYPYQEDWVLRAERRAAE